MDRGLQALRLARIAVALSAVAVVTAASGVTPATAVSAVKRALFASDSGAVDGISASRTPKPGQLLALDSSGRFPASVTQTARGPRGAQGPAGPAGPQGAQGPAGLVDVVTTKPRTTPIPAAGSQSVDVARAIIGPGTWMVLGSGYGIWDPAAGGVYLSCGLAVGAKALDTSVARLGSDAAAALAVPFSMSGAITTTTTTTLHVGCFHDQNITGNMRVESAHVTAIRIDSFTEQPGDGS